jgi:protein-S-isoprenylcysteine O-methyltransferase Ste14
MLKAPPPLWAIALLIAFYFLSDLNMFAGLPVWQWRVGAGVLLAIGVLGPIVAIAQFRRAHTEVSPTSKTNAKLVTSGIYALTRNPMYVGVIIASLGAALWFGRPLMFLTPLIIFAITNFVLIPFEEAKMARQFGAEFEAYTKRVRRWV